MADAFSGAANDIEAQRQAAVAALAAAGSQGAAAFAEGQKQIDAARTAAINQALSEAAQRGQGNIGGVVGGIVGSPYSQLSAGLASSAASHAADFATQGAAADRYFRELGSAVPMAAKQTEAAIARAKAKAANDLSDSELRTRLMGQGEILRDQDTAEARHLHHQFQTQVEDTKGKIADINEQLARWQANKPIKASPRDLLNMRSALEVQLAQARTSRQPYTDTLKQGVPSVESYARRAGIEAGFEPARVAGLIQPKDATPRQVFGKLPTIEEAAQRAGISPRVAKRIMRSSGDSANPSAWDRTVYDAERALKQGVPWETFYSYLDQHVPKHMKRLRALVTATYMPMFEAAGNGQ